MLPGAVLFGIGVQVLHVVTVVWIARSLESKSETYGALGAALTILLWAYLLGRLVTASASLNTVIWRDRSPTQSAL
jgi:membrane protein